MKKETKIALIIIATALISCEKEAPKNCACDKVATRSIIFTGMPDTGSYEGEITTVNECSGYKKVEQVSGQGHNAPNVGDCF